MEQTPPRSRQPPPPSRHTPSPGPHPRGKLRGSGPGPHPRGKLRGIRSRPTPKGEIEEDQDQTPPPPPPDDYCCGRYASYWNAFLFKLRKVPLSIWSEIFSIQGRFNVGLAKSRKEIRILTWPWTNGFLLSNSSKYFRIFLMRTKYPLNSVLTRRGQISKILLQFSST